MILFCQTFGFLCDFIYNVTNIYVIKIIYIFIWICSILFQLLLSTSWSVDFIFWFEFILFYLKYICIFISVWQSTALVFLLGIAYSILSTMETEIKFHTRLKNTCHIWWMDIHTFANKHCPIRIENIWLENVQKARDCL